MMKNDKNIGDGPDRRKSERVCLAISFIPPRFSGAGMRVYRYGQRLHRQGRLGCVISYRYRPANLQQAQARFERTIGEPIPAEKIFSVPFVPSAGGLLLRPVRFVVLNVIVAAYLLWILVRQRKSFDVLHCFSSNWLALQAVAIGKLLGKKVVWEMTLLGGDDPVTLGRTGGGITGWLKRYLLSKADVIISISPALSSAYSDSEMPGDKLRMVANPVDTERYHPVEEGLRDELREKLGLLGKGPIILFVGIVGPRKRVDLLVEAFIKVLARYPQALLLLVGPTAKTQKNRQMVEQIRERIREVQIEEQVVITGEVNNVEEYMKASDLFVFPSAREGLPNVVLEAMSSGLPVIARKIPGITDYIIEDGRDGLIIEEEDSEKFCAAMDKLLSDEGLRKRISQRARQTAISRFSTEVIDGQYEEIYDELRSGCVEVRQ